MPEMGRDLEEIHGALCNELAWLHWKSMEYVELFGKGQFRIDLMNQSAKQFFGLLQKIMLGDCLLHIARLTDPESTAGHDNLSILRLPGLVDDEDTKGELEQLIESAVTSANSCRDLRNRMLAHTDLQMALGQDAEPLEVANHETVEESLTALANVLNAVERHYEAPITAFGAIGLSWGAHSLMYVLNDGLRAQRERQERFEAGTARPEDHEVFRG